MRVRNSNRRAVYIGDWLQRVNAIYASFDSLDRLNYRIYNINRFGVVVGLGMSHRSSCVLNDVIRTSRLRTVRFD